MEFEYGIVLDTEGERMLVEAEPGGGCACCAAKEGCIAREGMKTRNLWMANTIGALPGDRVCFYIAEKGVMLASVLLYGLPVLMLLCGIIVGSFVHTRMGMERDIASIILGLAGIVLAYGILRILSPVLERSRLVQPVVVSVENRINNPSGSSSPQ